MDAPPRSARVQRILCSLDMEPGLTHAELAARVGLEPRHVLFLLHRLEGDGRVLHEANRWYPAPPP